MEYKLNAGGTSVSVSVGHDEETRFSAHIDGRTHEVELVRAEGDTLVFSVDGRQIMAGVTAVNEGKCFVINGCPYVVYDEEASGQNSGRRKKGDRVPDVVTPPMPAVVIRVLVAVGDAVKAGQAAVVISAMKMETTLKAPFDGTVTAVRASAGDKVSPGDVLVDIEKTDENRQSG